MFDTFPATRPPLEIVSVCPKCGSPVYGRGFVLPGESPQIQFSCDCRKAAELPVRTT